jgi:hypothetical protein
MSLTVPFGRGATLLFRDGVHVPLTPKAFETLLVPVENGGHVTEKDELLKKVWPDTFVEEVNLAKNVSFLRKLRGDNQINTSKLFPGAVIALSSVRRSRCERCFTDGARRQAETKEQRKLCRATEPMTVPVCQRQEKAPSSLQLCRDHFSVG